MSDQKQQGRQGRQSSGDRTDTVVHAGDASAVADDRGNCRIPPVSKQARSRRYLEHRLRSSQSYAAFASAGGADIFDGEPMERFAAVGKLDERTLRMRAQELREQIYADAIANQAPKKIEG